MDPQQQQTWIIVGVIIVILLIVLIIWAFSSKRNIFVVTPRTLAVSEMNKGYQAFGAVDAAAHAAWNHLINQGPDVETVTQGLIYLANGKLGQLGYGDDVKETASNIVKNHNDIMGRIFSEGQGYDQNIDWDAEMSKLAQADVDFLQKLGANLSPANRNSIAVARNATHRVHAIISKKMGAGQLDSDLLNLLTQDAQNSREFLNRLSQIFPRS